MSKIKELVEKLVECTNEIYIEWDVCNWNKNKEPMTWLSHGDTYTLFLIKTNTNNYLFVEYHDSSFHRNTVCIGDGLEIEELVNILTYNEKNDDIDIDEALDFTLQQIDEMLEWENSELDRDI